MTHKNHRMIVISQHNYEILRSAGTITDSFNSVITKLIDRAKLNENVATSGPKSYQEPGQIVATAPTRGAVNDK